MKKITMKKLERAKHGEILAYGTTYDSLDGINIWNTNSVIHWVAVRGMIGDWAVYMLGYWNKGYLEKITGITSPVSIENISSLDREKLIQGIRRIGTKTSKSDIPTILSVTRDAMDMYRT